MVKADWPKPANRIFCGILKPVNLYTMEKPCKTAILRKPFNWP
jgi:hypothetical protein